MIQRFEDEHPETRLEANLPSPPIDPSDTNKTDQTDATSSPASHIEPALIEAPVSDEEDGSMHPVLSRHNSDVSLASKALSQEEGRMHRFGQQFRRDLLKVAGESGTNTPDLTANSDPTTPDSRPMSREQDASTIMLLRSLLEEVGGEEVKRKIEEGGKDAEEEFLNELMAEKSALRQRLIDSDPEAWEVFVNSQKAAQKNVGVGDGHACGKPEHQEQPTP